MRSCAASRTAAHPRSRGENPSCPRTLLHELGSSPLTRGKHLATDTLPRDSGLIPAHAGKTPRRAAAALSRSAHPRSRGENEIARAEDVNSNGSSPLTRGKPDPTLLCTPTGGLIPAHAGKTDAVEWAPRGDRAHPRSRGENLAWAVDGARIRLIPAHAGKT